MKILYISDNRVRSNYGCRATSTALSMLVREKHEITGVVTGRYTHDKRGELLFFKYYPSCLYNFLGKHPFLRKAFYVFHVLFKKLSGRGQQFGPFDFVSVDMEKSIKNLQKCLPANSFLREFDIDSYDFDGAVVNGEGSFIFSTPGWRESFVISMCMYWALKKKKKIYFMNAMFSDSPFSERNMKTIRMVESIFTKCEVVVAREKVSFNYLKEVMPSIKPLLIPDALFTWYKLINDDHKVLNGRYYIAHDAECDESYYNQDFSKPYVLISGSSSSLISKNKANTIESYSYLAAEMKRRYSGNIYLIQVCEGDSFLNDVSKITGIPIIAVNTPLLAAAKILANARAFVSGRYHPAIMASQGGTPCVFMSSNSHKTYSLQELLKYDEVKEFDVIPTKAESNEMINKALGYINEGDALRERIKKRSFQLYEEARKMLDLIN